MIKSDLPINPDNELFRWGPIQAKAFFVSDFFVGIFDKSYFPEVHPGYKWPDGMALFNKSQMVFVGDLLEIQKEGGKLFLDKMLPVSARNKVREGWKENLSAMQAMQEKVGKTDFSSFSKEEFILLWHDFHEATFNFWLNIVIPELANYGSLPIIENELQKFIPDEQERSRAMEILTAPENPSFFQQEEIDLAKTDNIESHQRKYFWLRNSYAEVEVLPVNFFEKHKQEISPNIRDQIEEKKERTIKRKKELAKEYNLPENILDIARTIVLGIEWQDERKANIWQYLHYKFILLNEASKRLSVGVDDLLNFREVEIGRWLKGEDLSGKVLERKNSKGFLCAEEVKEIPFEKAKEYWEIYTQEKFESDVKDLKGVIACKGNGNIVKGKVKIVLDPKKAIDFKKGEILVTTMTTPEFIFIMKNSLAIVTDTGGLTSHAAVVSRELNKPCIIGTKIATKVLKDGDMVEVDAERGIVKIVNNGQRVKGE